MYYSIGLEGSGKEIHIKKSDVVVLTPAELTTKPFLYPTEMNETSDQSLKVQPVAKMEYFGFKQHTQNDQKDVKDEIKDSASSLNNNGNTMTVKNSCSILSLF